MNASQFAAARGISRQRVHQFIREGRIPTAFQVGKIWLIPEDAEILPGKTKNGRPPYKSIKTP
jgi:predicted site-specific integrase-resolvase